MTKRLAVMLMAMLLCASSAFSEENEIVIHDSLMEHEDGHLMDMGGAMVMNQNTERLPESCDRVSGDMEVTVRAGRKYAKDFPGTVFAFDKQEIRVKPCTRLTVHFINEDKIRHQWMVHGLPKYIYKSGMFHMEVTGPGQVDGTFILPANDQTYLVHCDMAQHMEKGLKGQLIVGKGGIPIPSVPGATAPLFPDAYPTQEDMYPKEFAAIEKQKVLTDKAQAIVTQSNPGFFSASLLIGLVTGLVLTAILGQRYKGQTREEVIADLSNVALVLVQKTSEYITLVVNKIKELTSKSSV